MPTPVELYPLSTQDAQSIPLDIVRPLAMIYVALTTTFTAHVLSSKFNLCAIYSSVEAYIDLTNTASGNPTSGTEYNGWMYIPAETVVIAEMPTATVKIRGRVLGDMHITAIQRWAALGLPRQFNSKTS